MNKKRVFVILAAIALVLGACFSPWKEDEGIFSVSIGGESRAAWNGTEILAELAHTITLSDGPGPEQTRENVKYGSTVNFSVTPGRWTITITASRDEEIYATGSQPVDIKPGRNGAIAIKMTPVNSGGSGGAEEPGRPVEPERPMEPEGPPQPYNFIIEFKDEVINISDIPTSISIPADNPLTITVIGNYDSYQWYIDGIALPYNLEGIQYGLQSQTLTIYVLPAGKHRVTAVVVKNNIPYSKIVEFKVE